MATKDSKRRTKYVAVTMTADEHRALTKRAAEEGIPVARLVRRLIGLEA